MTIKKSGEHVAGERVKLKKDHDPLHTSPEKEADVARSRGDVYDAAKSGVRNPNDDVHTGVEPKNEKSS